MNTNIRRLIYHIRYRYPTREIVTILLVMLVIVWFIWGSVQAMQKNYELKRTVENKRRDAELIELQTRTAEYEQRSLQSTEYKKLAARQELGLADPGEKVIILPPNSATATQADLENNRNTPPKATPKPSNISQWANFLFGGNVREDS